MGEWIAAVPAVLVGFALVVLPGLAVRFAGWPVRDLLPYLFVPAVSVAVVAVAANIAPVLGLRWSPVPIALVTAVAAGVALLLRRWTRREVPPAPSRRAVIAATAGAVGAVVVLTVQLASAFGSPSSFSQTFDNIVHLNAIRLALDAGDASAFAIGRTSDIGFYPDSWHSIVTQIIQLAHTSIPVGVNAGNIAIGAVVWPLSCMALAAVLFRERPAALIAAAALSTGFGAFPFLLLSWGVLYPNATGYAPLPAGLAAVILLLRGGPAAVVVRNAVLLVVVCAAIGLGHPNAFLALYAMGAAVTVWHFARRIIARPRSAGALRDGAIVLGVLVVGAALWRFGRTGSAMSQWQQWQSVPHAVLEAALISPRDLPATIPVVILVAIGLVTIIRRPLRCADVGLPFAVVSFMFVMASGVPAGTFVRDMVTNPWYNDPYRLAALLPVAGIPVATLGALVVVDVAIVLLARMRASRGVTSAVAVVGAAAFFAVGFAPSAAAGVSWVRSSYELTDDTPLLTTDELALLDRVAGEVPSDDLILANPWTGASLAFAFADRAVVSKHVFGTRTPDVQFIGANLDAIETDPDVCAAVDRVGAGWVLDFGDRNVWSNPDVGHENDGLNDLTAGRHLELVDSEGPSARLFRISGC